MMPSYNLRVKEQNGEDYLCCPDCSAMYQRYDADGRENEIPRNCTRRRPNVCGCPMDRANAGAFSDAKAKAAHDPELSRIGRTIRGQHSAVLDAEPVAAE